VPGIRAGAIEPCLPLSASRGYIRRMREHCTSRRETRENARPGLADTTAISITAIVVSGVAGPALTAWWTRNRQRRDHESEFRAELRAVLDEGANAVGAAKRCFERIYNLRREHVEPDSSEAETASVKWREAMQDVQFLEARIAIRVGDGHPVHSAYVVWLDTLKPLRVYARAYERGELSPALIERQRQGHTAFEPARALFIEAARKLLGSSITEK